MVDTNVWRYSIDTLHISERTYSPPCCRPQKPRRPGYRKSLAHTPTNSTTRGMHTAGAFRRYFKNATFVLKEPEFLTLPSLYVSHVTSFDALLYARHASVCLYLLRSRSDNGVGQALTSSASSLSSLSSSSSSPASANQVGRDRPLPQAWIWKQMLRHIQYLCTYLANKHTYKYSRVHTHANMTTH